jgi:Heparinase II/III N-terminus/Heparinase II/III-like protein
MSVSLKRRARDLLRSSPQTVVRKGLGLIEKRVWNAVNRARDLERGTFETIGISVPLNRFLQSVPAPSPENDMRVRLLSELFLCHFFDLLGSGWVEVFHGMPCGGFEGYRYSMGSSVTPDRCGDWLDNFINSSNLTESKRIWQLVDEDYMPIDWQLDFKSGYRWTERTWSRDIRHGHRSGVDIKVPWELARMQHLPQLAWAYICAKEERNGFKPAFLYAREFRNQILDFICTNPPRFGVNWCCTMDVGMRIVNWLVAYDLFRSFGVAFDTEFEAVFKRSIYEHGKHCIGNLENEPHLRNNHYLANIAGLLFISAYLPNSPETDFWHSFAVYELVAEMHHQFNADGSNFEASTSYHRLSTEIMLYCGMLCMSLPDEKRKSLTAHVKPLYALEPWQQVRDEPSLQSSVIEVLPEWFWLRLERAVEFTFHMTKTTGAIAQIGDNDSGRFLKIWPGYDALTETEARERYRNLSDYDAPLPSGLYLDEDILDHRHVLEVGGILFGRSDLLQASGLQTPEGALAVRWLNGITAPSSPHADHQFSRGRTIQLFPWARSVNEWRDRLTNEQGSPLEMHFCARKERPPLTNDMHLIAYQDFGVYLYRSPRLFLAVRCGSTGQAETGAHAHNDQLSIELSIDDEDIVRDPGTYVYTSSPRLRNLFRSTFAHFTPRKGKGIEQNPLPDGLRDLFILERTATARCLYFGHDGFVGTHKGFGDPVFRVILLGPQALTVLDFGAYQWEERPDFFSNGYGKWLK